MKLFFRRCIPCSASAEVVHKRDEAPGARLVLGAPELRTAPVRGTVCIPFPIADRSIYKLLHSFQIPQTQVVGDTRETLRSDIVNGQRGLPRIELGTSIVATRVRLKWFGKQFPPSAKCPG
jgi:hypothetical protein